MPYRMKGASFLMKLDSNGNLLPNEYYCADCRRKGIDHSVVSVPHGATDQSSCWGAGIPTTRRECTGCKCWDGPWVSSDLVGGGY